MNMDLFGKLDTTEKKDIETLKKLMEEKRNKTDCPDNERKPVSA